MSFTRGIDPIDEPDVNNPLCVSEYVGYIYRQLLKLQREDRHRSPPGYMIRQTDINEKMRGILVDWLIDVHLKFRLLPETMYLTVSILDRFLSKKSVAREKLQLVGVSAMALASTYEEIYQPEVNDFVYISANAYSRDEILQMKNLILEVIDWRLSSPNIIMFIRRYSKIAMSDYKLHTLTKYLAEVCLVDYECLKMLPSEAAVGAVYLAQMMTMRAFRSAVAEAAGVDLVKALDFANQVNMALHRVTSTLQAVVRKYSSKKFGEVAKIPMIRDIYCEDEFDPNTVTLSDTQGITPVKVQQITADPSPTTV